MAQSVALTSSAHLTPLAIAEGELVVTSALDIGTRISLPSVVSGGAGAAVDYGYELAVIANGQGQIEVLDFEGRRVCIVPAYRQFVLRARNGGSRNMKEWAVLEDASHTKGATIADLAVTDGAATASAASFNASYVEATVEANVAAATQTVLDEIEANLAVSFGEVQTKVNAIIAACVRAGLFADISEAEGTDTLALADVETWQIVDDSERLVTSARSHPTYCTLPAGSSDGATTTVPPKHSVKIVATTGAPIFVRDFKHRLVTVVPGFTQHIVRNIGNSDDYDLWTVIDRTTSSEAVKDPQPTIAPLSATMPTGGTASCNLASSYSDADFNAAVDTTIDAVFDALDTACATAFASVETAVNAILVALEGLDVVADS